MKRIYWMSFWGMAIFHFIATVTVVMKRFTMGMSRFDSGAPATSLETTLGTVQHILLFPVGSVGVFRWFQGFLHGVLGWLPIMLNSMVWATIIVGIAIAFRRIKELQNQTPERTG
jgi:hypothetical protein